MAVDRNYINNVFNIVLQTLSIIAGAALITIAVLRLGGWAGNPYLWNEEFDIISAVVCVYFWYELHGILPMLVSLELESFSLRW
jgi:hypothetical protein